MIASGVVHPNWSVFMAMQALQVLWRKRKSLPESEWALSFLVFQCTVLEFVLFGNAYGLHAYNLCNCRVWKLCYRQIGKARRSINLKPIQLKRYQAIIKRMMTFLERDSNNWRNYRLLDIDYSNEVHLKFPAKMSINFALLLHLCRVTLSINEGCSERWVMLLTNAEHQARYCGVSPGSYHNLAEGWSGSREWRKVVGEAKL